MILQVTNLWWAQLDGTIDLDEVWLILAGLIYAPTALLIVGWGASILLQVASHSPAGLPNLVPIMAGFPRQSREQPSMHKCFSSPCLHHACQCSIGQASHEASPVSGLKKGSSSWWQELQSHIAKDVDKEQGGICGYCCNLPQSGRRLLQSTTNTTLIALHVDKNHTLYQETL